MTKLLWMGFIVLFAAALAWSEGLQKIDINNGNLVWKEHPNDTTDGN